MPEAAAVTVHESWELDVLVLPGAPAECVASCRCGEMLERSLGGFTVAQLRRLWDGHVRGASCG